MEISVDSHNTVKAIYVSGELNAATAPELDERLSNLIIGGNKKLIIDLSGLEYISSAGLRVLLSANKSILKNNGELRIVGINGVVKEVFEISGFNMVFKIYEDKENALKSF